MGLGEYESGKSKLKIINTKTLPTIYVNIPESRMEFAELGDNQEVEEKWTHQVG